LNQIKWGLDVKVALISNVANGCQDLDDRKAVRMLIESLRV